MNLSTKYLNLDLKNPLIVGSSGITSSISNIIEIERLGAAAVVLKSLFEEQIEYEIARALSKSNNPEADALIERYVRYNSVSDYLNLIETAKKEVEIPVIASIHCNSTGRWAEFSRKIEDSGADALELNINIFPQSVSETSSELEKRYLEITGDVVSKTKIPIAVKIGSRFTNLLNFLAEIQKAGARAVVLFNRFYEPDFDMRSRELKSAPIFTDETDFYPVLRWLAIARAAFPDMDISASSGIHSAQNMLKAIAVGADTTQIVSVLYKENLGKIRNLLADFSEQLQQLNFASSDALRSEMSYSSIPNPEVYERSQFMNYFSSH